MCLTSPLFKSTSNERDQEIGLQPRQCTSKTDNRGNCYAGQTRPRVYPHGEEIARCPNSCVPKPQPAKKKKNIRRKEVKKDKIEVDSRMGQVV